MRFFRYLSFSAQRLLFLFEAAQGFYFVSCDGNRLRYHLLIETNNGEKTLIHKSNELFGKNPLSFAIASFENGKGDMEKSIFNDSNIKYYIFELYEGEKLYGISKLERKDIEKVIKNTNGNGEDSKRSVNNSSFNVKKVNDIGFETDKKITVINQASHPLLENQNIGKSTKHLTEKSTNNKLNIAISLKSPKASKQPRQSNKKLTSPLKKDNKKLTTKEPTGIIFFQL